MINLENFQASNAVLPVVIGVTCKREYLINDLIKMPNLLVAGRTGQGKSLFLHRLISALIQSRTANELQFVLIDPKVTEFSRYQNISQYLYSATDIPPMLFTDAEDSLNAVKALHEEMNRRYLLLGKANCRSILDYNSKTEANMSYIVLVIDELADLITIYEDNIEYPLWKLLCLGRAVGIHVVIATARPSESVLSGRLLSNLPTKLVFDTDNLQYVISNPDISPINLPQVPGDALYNTNNEIIPVHTLSIDDEEIKEFYCV